MYSIASNITRLQKFVYYILPVVRRSERRWLWRTPGGVHAVSYLFCLSCITLSLLRSTIVRGIRIPANLPAGLSLRLLLGFPGFILQLALSFLFFTTFFPGSWLTVRWNARGGRARGRVRGQGFSLGFSRRDHIRVSKGQLRDCRGAILVPGTCLTHSALVVVCFHQIIRPYISSNNYLSINCKFQNHYISQTDSLAFF